MRPWHLLAALGTAGAGVIAVPATSPAAAAAPDSTITAPAGGALLRTGPTVFRGQATDADSVQVAVQDRDSKLWWHADGTWGEQQRFTAALSAGSWSFTWTAPEAGDYLVQAFARGGAVTDATPPYTPFTMLTLASGTAPDTAVAAPGAGSIVRAGTPLTARGLATAGGRVASVGVAVQNRATRLWWRADGTWGAYQRHPAALGGTAPDGRTVAWTFGWTPPADGDYAFQAVAADGGGTTDATPADRPFGADGNAPDGTVTGAQDRSHPARRAVTWTGTATDARGVADVQVAVQNRATKLWWHADGTWGAFARYPAAITGPSGTAAWTVADGRRVYTSAGWAFRWTPPAAGDYGLQVTAIDAAQRADATLPYLRFSATAAPADTVRPSAAFTAPTADRTLTAGPIRVSGSAADDVAVTAVHLAIQNRDTGQWWQPGGGWGAYKRIAPVTTGLGTPSATWTYDWTPPQAGGRYLAHVEAFDAAGNVAGETARPSVRFGHRPGGTGLATLLLSRSQWQAVDQRCAPLRGAVPLGELASELGKRGVRATGTVVVDRTGDSTRQCVANFTDYATWADLAKLRDTSGWSFISHGATYADMTALTPDQQKTESCGSLTALRSHGHDRAWGLFAYPNNKYSALTQQVVSSCFAYGRQYGFGRNTSATTAAPYFQSTWSWPSGRCNDPTLTCSTWVPTSDSSIGVYTSPERLAAALAGGADEWQTVQGYKFLRGRRIATANQGQQWDCTSSDWRAHWTNSAESYCLSDLLTALSLARGTTFTDPATVAQTWGRRP
ncbi:Ig-like domain-containing protein [Actinomadura roseirufa]|uniref:Ig-like domain-containing protein n=1 Tax=Actinomadura roseirufa TaxID=2094049 RepID=UPI0010410320|nr:Ig-like domain-containing protein [Actinomadura roseirufa]